MLNGIVSGLYVGSGQLTSDDAFGYDPLTDLITTTVADQCFYVVDARSSSACRTFEVRSTTNVVMFLNELDKERAFVCDANFYCGIDADIKLKKFYIGISGTTFNFRGIL